ncbi:MAG: DUF896 domain-containing protein [Syntrophomonadaceae bacterium]|nr:DUF896 domain-containing protein [Syntrophomonadaceae bacterium]
MDAKQIARINELARIKKERGLTKTEAKEQEKLYNQVLKNVRSQVTSQLNNAGYNKKSASCQCGCQSKDCNHQHPHH